VTSRPRSQSPRRRRASTCFFRRSRKASISSKAAEVVADRVRFLDRKPAEAVPDGDVLAGDETLDEEVKADAPFCGPRVSRGADLGGAGCGYRSGPRRHPDRGLDEHLPVAARARALLMPASQSFRVP
jgi:hypothetical protein